MRRLWPLVAVAIIVIATVPFLMPNKKHSGQKPAVNVVEALGGTPEEGFARAVKPRRFSFPDDHGPHSGFRTEWWYFTGNLQTAEGRRFGYQLTFFRIALKPWQLQGISKWRATNVFMAHFAITDVEGEKYYFRERFSRAAMGLAGAGGKPLKVWLEDWTALETSGEPWGMRLTASDGPLAINLDVTSVRPPVLNGDRGLSRKGSATGNSSYYYSMPRLQTSGTIRIGKDTLSVTGLSWLDREWSTSALEGSQEGWDWFALQLADGRDIMFYRLRGKGGTTDPLSSGTFIAADGMSRHLTAADVRLEITDWWQSPESSVRYPSRWRLRIPREKIDLEIVPRLADQELLASVRYWEGTVAVRSVSPGSSGGSGYVELTGYQEQIGQ